MVAKLKYKKDIDHHDPKHISTICHLRNSPHFSFAPTFNIIHSFSFRKILSQNVQQAAKNTRKSL
jgi:hypothetical protein